MSNYISKKDQEHIDARLAEKTRREPSLPPTWEPPIAKLALSKEDARLVDKALRDMMKPLPQRD